MFIVILLLRFNLAWRLDSGYLGCLWPKQLLLKVLNLLLLLHHGVRLLLLLSKRLWIWRSKFIINCCSLLSLQYIYLARRLQPRLLLLLLIRWRRDRGWWLLELTLELSRSSQHWRSRLLDRGFPRWLIIIVYLLKHVWSLSWKLHWGPTHHILLIVLKLAAVRVIRGLVFHKLGRGISTKWILCLLLHLLLLILRFELLLELVLRLWLIIYHHWLGTASIHHNTILWCGVHSIHKVVDWSRLLPGLDLGWFKKRLPKRGLLVLRHSFEHWLCVIRGRRWWFRLKCFLIYSYLSSVSDLPS